MEVIDPLAPKYSSYIYIINNPIKFIDPDGMEIGIAGDKEAQDVLIRTNNATRVQVEHAARKIYANYPEILSRLGL